MRKRPPPPLTGHRRRRTTGRLPSAVLRATQFGFESDEIRPKHFVKDGSVPGALLSARAWGEGSSSRQSLASGIGPPRFHSGVGQPGHATAGAPVASRALRVEPTPREPDRISEADARTRADNVGTRRRQRARLHRKNRSSITVDQMRWEGTHDEDRVVSHSRDRSDRQPLPSRRARGSAGHADMGISRGR